MNYTQYAGKAMLSQPMAGKTDEEIKETVVSCTFKGDTGVTTFVVKHLAYLMSDDGKTADRIRRAEHDGSADEDTAHKTLQEAANIALTAED